VRIRSAGPVFAGAGKRVRQFVDWYSRRMQAGLAAEELTQVA
jgi:hypothetical protein